MTTGRPWPKDRYPGLKLGLKLGRFYLHWAPYRTWHTKLDCMRSCLFNTGHTLILTETDLTIEINIRNQLSYLTIMTYHINRYHPCHINVYYVVHLQYAVYSQFPRLPNLSRPPPRGRWLQARPAVELAAWPLGAG